MPVLDFAEPNPAQLIAGQPIAAQPIAAHPIAAQPNAVQPIESGSFPFGQVSESFVDEAEG